MYNNDSDVDYHLGQNLDAVLLVFLVLFSSQNQSFIS